MADIKKIMVATDFSDCGRYAVEYAATLAAKSDAELHVVNVIDTGYLAYAAMYGQNDVIDPNIASVEQAAVDNLDGLLEGLRAKGRRATGHLEKGKPADAILEVANSEQCDLLVTGTHGYTGLERFLFGSTCERIVRRSEIPVLAVKLPSEGAIFNEDALTIEKVLCTTDLSGYSKRALPYASALCRAYDAELILLHVVDTRQESFPHLAAVDQPDLQTYIDHAKKALDEMADILTGITVKTKVVTGIPHKQIDRKTVDENVDVLVIATHGHGAVLHALLGSTAEKVVRLAHCPVLTVRPE